ncbi:MULTISPECIES: hypothetical protein [unclassified Frankia]|uniref:hypothetical protein n=1 Tax=unclassified Frankia TaxID=2632575 RepID=UPI001EF3E309|nr:MULTISPECIES: hypothetical protein [unclassified Frankia]
MPKNYGQGVGVDSWRAGGLRGLVRLGRIELWTRLDRNMLRPPEGLPAAGPSLSRRRHHRDADDLA